jgi:hypothetical protein
VACSPECFRRRLPKCWYSKSLNSPTPADSSLIFWLVSFMDYDLGYIDLEKNPCSPWRTPSGQKV